jgi:hypothetical protein
LSWFDDALADGRLTDTEKVATPHGGIMHEYMHDHGRVSSATGSGLERRDFWSTYFRLGCGLAFRSASRHLLIRKIQGRADILKEVLSSEGSPVPSCD